MSLAWRHAVDRSAGRAINRTPWVCHRADVSDPRTREADVEEGQRQQPAVGESHATRYTLAPSTQDLVRLIAPVRTRNRSPTRFGRREQTSGRSSWPALSVYPDAGSW